MTARIRATQTFSHNGAMVTKGQEIELAEPVAALYIREGKAVPAADEAPAKERDRRIGARQTTKRDAG